MQVYYYNVSVSKQTPDCLYHVCLYLFMHGPPCTHHPPHTRTCHMHNCIVTRQFSLSRILIVSIYSLAHALVLHALDATCCRMQEAASNAQKAAELAALTPSLIRDPLPLRVAYLRSWAIDVLYAESAGSPGEKHTPLLVRVISQA